MLLGVVVQLLTLMCLFVFDCLPVACVPFPSGLFHMLVPSQLCLFVRVVLHYFASLYALVAFGVVRWWFCGAWLLEWRFGVDAWQRACYAITAFIVGVGCRNRFVYTLLFVVVVSSFCPLEI